jgi:hypothetical protein
VLKAAQMATRVDRTVDEIIAVGGSADDLEMQCERAVAAVARLRRRSRARCRRERRPANVEVANDIADLVAHLEHRLEQRQRLHVVDPVTRLLERLIQHLRTPPQ